MLMLFLVQAKDGPLFHWLLHFSRSLNRRIIICIAIINNNNHSIIFQWNTSYGTTRITQKWKIKSIKNGFAWIICTDLARGSPHVTCTPSKEYVLPNGVSSNNNTHQLIGIRNYLCYWTIHQSIVLWKLSIAKNPFFTDLYKQIIWCYWENLSQ